MAGKKEIKWRAWLPLFGLVLSTFVVNTTEFIPVGLLNDIAADFGISESKAGFLITAYAWVVAVASLPLMLLCARVERRLLLTLLFVLFIGSHVLSFFAQTYTVLLISRVGVACSHAVFFSISAPLAVRVTPEGYRAFGLSMLAGGGSIAMILGLPLGRIIGLNYGWRTTFLVIAVVALINLIVLWLVLPKQKTSESGTLHHLPMLFKNRALVSIYLLTALIITAHFTCYSYIEPLLITAAGFTPEFGTFVLLLFGLAGIVGSYLFSKFNDSQPYRLIKFAIIGIIFSMLLIRLASFNEVSVTAVCIAWGVSIMVLGLVMQLHVIRLAPEATSIAMSIYSGIYNIGIGTGALVGGLVCTHSALDNVGYFGATLGVAALLFFVFAMSGYFKTVATKQE